MINIINDENVFHFDNEAPHWEGCLAIFTNYYGMI